MLAFITLLSSLCLQALAYDGWHDEAMEPSDELSCLQSSTRTMLPMEKFAAEQASTELISESHDAGDNALKAVECNPNSVSLSTVFSPHSALHGCKLVPSVTTNGFALGIIACFMLFAAIVLRARHAEMQLQAERCPKSKPHAGPTLMPSISVNSQFYSVAKLLETEEVETIMEEATRVMTKLDGDYQKACSMLKLRVEEHRTSLLTHHRMAKAKATAKGADQNPETILASAANDLSALWKHSRQLRREATELLSHSSWPSQATDEMLRRLRECAFFHSKGMSEILLQVSEQYHARSSKGKKAKEALNSEPDLDRHFQRHNKKFTMATDDIIDFVCKALPHLPASVFKKNTDILCSTVSSVYMDNDHLDFFATRVTRSKPAAPLYRLRWYGEYETQTVFVERKRKGDVTTGAAATKDRFCLAEAEVNDYVFRGTEKRSSEAGSLRAQFQQELQSMNARPTSRTCCKRLALQFEDSEAVRITIDWDLAVLLEASPETEQNWRRPVRLQEPYLQTKELKTFDKAIIEVKLQQECPEWLTSLLEEKQLKEVDISKYEYSIVSLLPDRAPVVPWWIQEMSWSSGMEVSLNDQTDASSMKPKQMEKPLDPKVVLKIENVLLAWVGFAMTPLIAGKFAQSNPSFHHINMLNSALVLGYAIKRYMRRLSDIKDCRQGYLADSMAPFVLSGSACVTMLTIAAGS